MKTTISLKQLRTDPRGYIRMLNQGYEVAITEHRQVMVSAVQAQLAGRQNGNVDMVLDALKNLPPIDTPYPEMDTVDLIKKTRTEAYDKKFGSPKTGKAAPQNDSHA